MNVLAIDTSTNTMGIALSSEGVVLGEVITNLKKNHSERLMPAVERLLQDCGISPNQLDSVVVAKGPGSYTGVRIGVTIAKTLAWSLNIPLRGISSLEMLAMNGRYFQGLICPLFDARRGRVYTGLYQPNGDVLEQLIEDQNVDLVEWLEKLKMRKKEILFIGNDVALHKDNIAEHLKRVGVIAPTSMNNPRPSELLVLGETREPEDIHQFVPNYIRLAEAEAKWLESKER